MLDEIVLERKEKYIRRLEELQQQDPTLQELLTLLQHAKIFVPAELVKSMELQKKEDTEYLTVEETAELLKMSKSAVYKWIRQNKIQYLEPIVENGKGYLIPKEQFAERLRQKPKYEPLTADKVMEGYKELLKGDTDLRLVNPQDVLDNK